MSFMMSSHKLDFLPPTALGFSRSPTKPTSAYRRSKPHAQAFKTMVLPSGGAVNVLIPGPIAGLF
jgi:hypothetical protein